VPLFLGKKDSRTQLLFVFETALLHEQFIAFVPLLYKVILEIGISDGINDQTFYAPERQPQLPDS
jgi:hypothetical protein